MKIRKRFFSLTVLLASLALAPFPLWSQIGSEAGKAQKQTGAGGAEQGQKRIQAGGQSSSSSSAKVTTSDDIKKLQQALKAKGQDPGPINGVMGAETQAALRAFQTKQDLNATGTLDAQTRSALGLGAGGSAMSGNASSKSSAEVGTSAEPAMPKNPSVKPGEPLPPENSALPGSSSKRTSAEERSSGVGIDTSVGVGVGVGARGGAGGSAGAGAAAGGDAR
jgi:peptidoglycan hydrolase-like protein with peptidoglycan-binding domain